MFLQPNQYLISTSIQPSPLGPSNQSQMLPSRFQYLITTHYRSIQPSQMLHSGLAACPTVLPRAVMSTSPRPKLPAPHPLLLASSKVPKSPLLLVGSKVPKRHRLSRPNGHPMGPESCWNSAVSGACPRRAATCRLRMRSNAKASSPTHPLLLAAS